MPYLHWLTRDEDIKKAKVAPYRLLEPVPELAAGDPHSPNMLIQGDNLEALKALLPYYAGRVKCIYADPPFNTQQALPDYDDSLEHTIWLSIIYPALELQRDLLAQDGTLFIHIDDNELGYLIAIADEVLGRENRVAIITFKQGAATGHKAINPGMVNTTNFVLVYARNKRHWKPRRLFTGRERDKRYNQFLDNPLDHYSKWKLMPLTKAFSDKHRKRIGDLKKELGASFEDVFNDFVIENADRVIQSVRPSYEAVSEDARKLIDQSTVRPDEIFLLKREGFSDMYFKDGQRWIFYRDKLKLIDGVYVAGEPLTTLWDDLLSNNLHKEGDVELPKGKKPEALIKRILELSTAPGDLVLDAYLGSGTTAAAAHKMGRWYIGIERGEHAVTKCQLRLANVVRGDASGISKAVDWEGGGGFRFYRLGEAVFDEEGRINPKVKFAALAAHVWFTETGRPMEGNPKKPFLGIHDGIAYGLLYNGVLGDKSVNGGNVLTSALLERLKREARGHTGPWVLYGEVTRLSAERLRTLRVTFKQTPYDIRAR